MTDSQSPTPDELAVLATVIALASAKVLNVEQLNVYGNFIVAIGSLMLTIAAQQEALNKQAQEPEPDTSQQIKELQNQLKKLLEQESTPK